MDILDVCEGERRWKGTHGFCPVHQIGAETTRALVQARNMLGELGQSLLCSSDLTRYANHLDDNITASLARATNLPRNNIELQPTSGPRNDFRTQNRSQTTTASLTTGPYNHSPIDHPVDLDLAPFMVNGDGNIVDAVVRTLAARFKDKAMEVQALGATCQDEKTLRVSRYGDRGDRVRSTESESELERTILRSMEISEDGV